MPFQSCIDHVQAAHILDHITTAVAQVNAVRKSGRFAWVEFQTLQAAQTAMSLDGESLGTGTMKVSASKTPIHTAGWRAQVGLAA